jgi:hypothetical protein
MAKTNKPRSRVKPHKVARDEGMAIPFRHNLNHQLRTELHELDTYITSSLDGTEKLAITKSMVLQTFFWTAFVVGQLGCG